MTARWLCVLSLAGCVGDSVAPDPTPEPAAVAPSPPATSQLVTVVTDSWDAVDGTLVRWQGAPGSWTAVSAPIEVVVGRNGLGWGRGLDPPGDDGPIKQEGDGRAPAGRFVLSAAYGVMSRADTALPYAQTRDELVCVDDPKSPQYNRIVAEGNASAASFERMRRADALYDWVITVDHNVDPVAAGAGSCIFLHVWRRAGSGTHGCTAFEDGEVARTVRWLSPDLQPQLVQLPRAEFDTRAANAGWPKHP